MEESKFKLISNTKKVVDRLGYMHFAYNAFGHFEINLGSNQTKP